MSEARYPTYAEIVARRRAERRDLLLRAARAAEAAARERGLRVIVFGSLATGDVHERSDLDIALVGPGREAYAAEGEVFFAAARLGVDADIVALERANPAFRERILRDGRDPALWADIQRDLAAAREAARGALEAAEGVPTTTEPLPRAGLEALAGKRTHDAYCALETAFERLALAFDGGVPRTARWHAALLDLMGEERPRVRPAVLSEATRADLRRLVSFRHAYRHVYEGYDFARAEELLPVVARAVPAAAAEVEAFCRAQGIAPPGA
jgi:predicted nucleotidyltransferase